MYFNARVTKVIFVILRHCKYYDYINNAEFEIFYLFTTLSFPTSKGNRTFNKPEQMHLSCLVMEHYVSVRWCNLPLNLVVSILDTINGMPILALFSVPSQSQDVFFLYQKKSVQTM